MGTAGYGMKFGKGYLGPGSGGGKPMEQRQMGGKPMAEEGGDMHHAEIHEHLQNMHAATGHAHSHVEHHGDGHHTSHHVGHDGQVSGPHEHENMEALHSHMQQFDGGGEGEHEDGGEREEED